MSKKQPVEYRTIKVKRNKEWVEVEFSELAEGDKFRVWEPDGTIIRVNNKYVFTATSLPFESTERGEPTLGINCEG